MGQAPTRDQRKREMTRESYRPSQGLPHARQDPSVPQGSKEMARSGGGEETAGPEGTIRTPGDEVGGGTT